MKGSIQKKGKIYYAVIPIAGKRKWFRGGTKKDAERVLGEKLGEISQGTYRDIPKTTFIEFTKLWIKSHDENNVKPSTLVVYNHIIDKKLNLEFGHHLMTDITQVMIQSYIKKRKQGTDARVRKKDDGESEKPKKVLSAKTISNEIVIIKQIFKHAQQWGYVKINPAEHLKRPKMKKHEIEILDLTEFNKLLECSDDHYRVAFLTAIETGVRAGELWGLQWGDMDWNLKKLHVKRSVWNNAFQTPKTTNALREIDITNDLVFELKKWQLACPISEHNLMFPTKTGHITCHDNVIKRYFGPALTKAKLKHVSFHSLRHTNASLRIRAEQNPKYMSMQMGHSSIKITMDTYGHLFNDDEFNRQQADLLQATFNSVRNPLEKPLQNVKKELAIS